MCLSRIFAAVGFWLLSAMTAAGAPPIVALSIDGAIGPATADYVERGLTAAAKQGAQLVVLTLDTPGGLDTSMRQIVRDILASPVPVVAYVAPSGARAASAGTFVLYASHVAAMAPGTNLGAASPVSIGLGATKPDAPASADSDKKGPPRDVHERKAFSDAAAYIRSLAQLRGRNADWGEQAVVEAASLSASEARERGVVELLAPDSANLLRQLDGRKVSTVTGERELHTAGAPILAWQPDWRQRILAIITDPSVALILMLIGIYGLIFEFGNPGLVFPGVAGAVCLLLASYAFHLLPVDYAGLLLVLTGIAFIVAEVFVPAYGSLGVGGAIALAVGALMLIDSDVPEFTIPWSLSVALASLSALAVIAIGRMALSARRAPLISGMESLVGAEGEMVQAADAVGWATIRGETWRVTTMAPLVRGQKIRVVAVEGTLPQVAAIEGG